MARLKVPYPPSPTDFPEDLTDPDHDSGLRVAAVLMGLFVFLFIYLGLIVACLAVIIAVTVSLATLSYPALWVIGAIMSAIFLVVLLKGLFNRSDPPNKMRFEITEEDQPILFAFLTRLTDEIGAPMPHRVFVTFEVNAAMQQEISLANLFRPTKKNLIIGLGLVNVLNLSEFKAVMGHEFGHFSQRTSKMHAYASLAMNVIINLVTGQDWLDRMVYDAKRHAKRSNDLSAIFTGLFGLVVGGAIWCCRMVLLGLFRMINFAALALSRKDEFHADRIAVSVAGSNAIVHALARLPFAEESLNHAIYELDVVSQRKQYSNDIYYHQSAAAHYLRKLRKKKHLGEPPELETPEKGKRVQVFDPDEESDIPEMWSSHPKNADREENAKEVFVVAPNDERSPWVLFTHRDELREEMTFRFYRTAFKVRKDTELTSAAEIQGSIDDEHAEMTFDPKYQHCYDERNISPGDVDELNAQVDAEPWDNERIARVHSRLYRELGRRVEDYADCRKAIRKLLRKCFGRPRGRDKRELEDLEEEFKGINEWFGSFDRRVYIVHAHMAKLIGITAHKEMTHRYRFHLELQTIHRELAMAMDQVEDIYAGLLHFGENPPPGFFEEMMDVFSNARRTMKRNLKRASEMLTPAMANVKKGTRFDKLIFELELLRELPETYVKGTWIETLREQMVHMRSRVNRMDFKSLGAILQMQDRFFKEWQELSTPPALLLDPVEPESPPNPLA